ncbi:MAG: alpha/beta hydrolase [Candidatus Tectomicrobia bacterium]|uniref:Alpha/beta hydrolase n=1 Tax=Tectimicrobiota bacterium TaxID=2528274 RepID=A0A938B1V7_UNCTE|nr:alpha/beta hydrolase [Candidatus Tectomicrobia bacterium]
MAQLVFIHGPGAGGCAEGFRYQLEHFPDSLAPHLPGHLHGTSCASVERYTDWLRGWLWAQGHQRDLVLVGFTLGSCIALQYALDYPDEVRGLVLMTVSMRAKQRPSDTLAFRLRAAEDPAVHAQWLDAMREAMTWVDPAFRERLIDCHRQVGPLSQHRDLVVIDRFDVQDRIHTLRAPLLLIRGMDDPLAPEEYEREIHEAVAGSQYIPLRQAGHFPMAEQPETVNAAIHALLTRLG